MHAELRAHRLADLVLLLGERGVLESLDHRTAAEEAKVATAARRAGVLRVGFRELGKAGGILAQLGHQLLSPRRDLLRLRIACAGLELQQDVPRATLLRLAETLRIAVVGGANFLLAHAHLFFHRGHVEHDVFRLEPGGPLEARRIGRIEAADLLVGGLDVCNMARSRKTHLADGAFLELGDQETPRRRCRDNGSLAHRRRNLLDAHILGDAGLEHCWRHALRTQHLFVALERETAILLEALEAGDGLLQGRRRHGEAALGAIKGEHALIHQVIEHGAAQFLGLQQRPVHLAAGSSAQAILLLAQRPVELRLADGLAIDDGNLVCARRVVEIGIQAEKGEGNDEQRENDLGNALVVANSLEHLEFRVSQ